MRFRLASIPVRKSSLVAYALSKQLPAPLFATACIQLNTATHKTGVTWDGTAISGGTQQWQNAYSYDVSGNRTQFTTDSVLAASYTYDAAERLTGVTGYDTDGTTILSDFSYAYDGMGNRVSQTDVLGATTVDYLLDVNSGLTRVLGKHISGGDDTYYLMGLDIIGQQDSSGWGYFGRDGLGSVRGIYDAAGGAAAISHYDPYGNLISAGAMGSSFGFAGEQSDPSGLQYLRARYYDPMTGRFISRDPVWGVQGSMSIGFNPYVYAAANPTNWTDPSGKIAPILIIAAAAVVGAAATAAMEYYEQRSSGVSHDCVDWGSVGIKALQGAALGAISGAVGMALHAAGASAIATFVISEGVDFFAGVGMDVVFNDMPLREAVISNAIGFGIGGALGVASSALAKAAARSGLNEVLAKSIGKAAGEAWDSVSTRAAKAVQQAADGPNVRLRNAGGGNPDADLSGLPSARTRDFAHSTSLENAQNILQNGLQENSARNSANRGLVNRPGSFFTIEVTPDTFKNIAPDLIAFGNRKVSGGDKPVIIVMSLPEDMFGRFVSDNSVTIRPIAGMEDLTETIFSPSTFSTIEQGTSDGVVTWQLVD